jgi:hypothetical protein
MSRVVSSFVLLDRQDGGMRPRRVFDETRAHRADDAGA